MKGSKMFKKFFNNNRGVAAVEFAIILPLMLFLFYGTSEITRAIMTKRKVETVVRITTDLVGQFTTLKLQGAKNEAQEIFAAATAIIEPYDKKPLTLKMTGIEIDEKGGQRVRWAFQNGKLIGCGGSFNIPASLMPPKGKAGFIIYGEADYAFKPITHLFMQDITLTEKKYWLARSMGSIITEPVSCY